jgi:hypothetical protein
MARHDDKSKRAPPQHDGGMSPGPAANKVISSGGSLNSSIRQSAPGRCSRLAPWDFQRPEQCTGISSHGNQLRLRVVAGCQDDWAVRHREIAPQGAPATAALGDG